MLHKTRLLAILTGCAMLCAAVPPEFLSFAQSAVSAAEETTGQCGENAVWRFSDGVLTISGTGEIQEVQNCVPSFDSIQEIIVEDGITSLGERAFAGLQKTEKITLPDSLTTIGEQAFSQTGLTSISIPAGVTALPSSCFSYCGLLKLVVLPDTLLSIGDRCFSNCKLLTDITIPPSVTSLGMRIFGACTAWMATHPEEFIIVGDGILYAYQGTDAEVIVPEGVKRIANRAFSSWQPLELPNMELFPDEPPFRENPISNEVITAISLPDTLTDIMGHAFSNLPNLMTFHIPDSVTHVGSVPYEWLATQPGDFLIFGDHVLYTYRADNAAVTVPDGVKCMTEYAFSSKSMVSVVLPDSLTSISECVFQRCTSLIDVQLSSGVQSIDDSAFMGCTNLTSITIPESVTDIAETAFADSGLKTIVGAEYSAAQAFAVAHGYEFVELQPQQPGGESMAIQYGTDNWSFDNSGAAFGTSYYLTDAAKSQLEDVFADGLSLSKFLGDGWGGSCCGLSTLVLLVKTGVYAPSDLQAGATKLSEITPTKEVQSCINYYQWAQFSAARMQAQTAASETPNQKFFRMLQYAKAVGTGGAPFLLDFTIQNTQHCVVGNGIESGSWTWNDVQYDSRILIWGPNFLSALKDEACLYFDSRSYRWCIPFYCVLQTVDGKTNVGSVNFVCNDPAVLNAAPYEGLPLRAEDVNGDGKASTADATLLQGYLLRENKLNAAQGAAADLDSSDSVTGFDLCLLKRSLMK